MRDIQEFIEKDSPADRLLEQIDPQQLPRHVAIIMDGNGRWASQKGLPRVQGHRAGIAAVRETVEISARLELEVLTLYAFSVENWKRPASEISVLMKLLKKYLRQELLTLQENDIRFCVIGRLQELESSIQRELREAMDRTASNRGLTFNIALNYGGRTEMVDAFSAMYRDFYASGTRPENLDLDEATVAKYLYTHDLPYPDLLIRTSGEMRVSNFLLWQIAYAEIWVTDTLWPDFRREDLLQGIIAYQQRERRYGGVLQTSKSRQSGGR